LRSAAAVECRGVPSEPIIITGVIDGPVPVEAVRPDDWPGDCGAEAVFVGRTRRETHEAHGELLRLHYEMYQPMVVRQLEQLARDAAAAHDCRYVLLQHARGDVGIGEPSVVIQVICGHRDEAFAACRELIERLKVALPIWKREVWQRGETFVDGNAAQSR